ncbi:MAG TPA: MmgE/PrpD family protein [Roseomonas sp.]
MTPAAAERLAVLVHGVQPAALPPAVVAHAKALILDSIGCMLGGLGAGVAAGVRGAAARLGGTPEATVIGTGLRTSCTLAAFANGTALRYLDSNDYYFGRDPAHPSGALPVALALAERDGRSGAELIAALVAGYEVHLRLADGAGAPSLWARGWHHSTNLAIAVAALAGRLLQDDAEVTAHAIAIAATHCNTLAQLQSGGIATIKATAEAFTAKTALVAALLAQHGVTGPLAVLEGEAGWVRAVAGQADLEALCAPFGGDWKLPRTCIKPYAAVATAMAPVQAALDLFHQDGVRADRIAAVTVKLPRFPLGTPSAHPGRRFPQTRESADHSFYFCVAIALLDGACGEAQFGLDRLQDPALRALLEKLELAEDAALTAGWPAAGGAVAVTLDDGRVLERRHAFPPGHPDNPLPPAALHAKFLDHALPVIGPARAKAVIAAVADLDRCPDIGSLMSLLSAPEGMP